MSQRGVLHSPGRPSAAATRSAPMPASFAEHKQTAALPLANLRAATGAEVCPASVTPRVSTGQSRAIASVAKRSLGVGDPGRSRRRRSARDIHEPRGGKSDLGALRLFRRSEVRCRHSTKPHLSRRRLSARIAAGLAGLSMAGLCATGAGSMGADHQLQAPRPQPWALYVSGWGSPNIGWDEKSLSRAV